MRGFTLIELGLVVTVLAVLLLAATPRFQGTAERLRTEQRAFELAHLLRYARERAITQALEVRWRWDEEERRVAVEALGDSGQWARLEERVAQSAPLTSQMALSVSDRQGEPVDCACVQFSPDGTTTPTSVVLRRGEEAFTVTVDGATGQPTVTAGLAPR